MERQNSIKINFENVGSTAAIHKYICEKFSKTKFVSRNIIVDGVNIKRIHSKGFARYSVSISVLFKKFKKYFTERGDDLYSIIDVVESKITENISKIKNMRQFRERKYLEYSH